MSPMWGDMTQYDAIQWGWLIVVYLFLAGISSGSIIVALLVKWNRHERSNFSIWDAMIKAGATVAPLSIFLGLFLLIFDLGKPLSFYLLFFNYNLTSVMSLGVIFLFFYTLIVLAFSLLVFERTIIKYPLLLPLHWCIDTLKSLYSYSKMIEYFLFFSAICVGSYAGFLLFALQPLPLWNSPILPILFLASGISSGVAVNILVGLLFFKSNINTESIKYLLIFDIRVILVELPLIALLFIGVYYSGEKQIVIDALTDGIMAFWFWFGVILIGLFLPLYTVIIALKNHKYKIRYILTNSLLVILGVLLLRYYIVFAGQIYIN